MHGEMKIYIKYLFLLSAVKGLISASTLLHNYFFIIVLSSSSVSLLPLFWQCLLTARR